MTKTQNFDPREARGRFQLNQSDFWTKVGVTQSGGSRYESGRRIPHPVKALLIIAYGSEEESRELVKKLRGGSK